MRKYEKLANAIRIGCVVMILLAIAMLIFMCFTGCNYAPVDTHWSFDRAIIELPDGTVIDGPVNSWKDFEDGDQIQVTVDGVTYLVHASKITLISK